MTTRKKHKAKLLAVEAVAAQNGICRKNDTQLTQLDSRGDTAGVDRGRRVAGGHEAWGRVAADETP